MKRYYLQGCLLLLSIGMAAQARMEFEKTVIQVGDIMFQQPKTIYFEFKNTGSQPLVIQDVVTSCECTSSQWEQKSIQPGATGKIEATYDAAFLGTFQKELEVYSNATTEPVYLTMKGRVTTAVNYDIDDFPIDLGNIRLSNNVVEFDDVNNGDHPEVVLEVANLSTEPYTPELMHLPSYLEARIHPSVIAPGRAGKIVLQLHSEELKDYGLTQTTIYLARYAGDKVSADNEIDVSALLLPAFAHLDAAAFAQAPQMFLSEDSLTFDFSTPQKNVWKRVVTWTKKVVTGKEKQTQRVIISNLGKTDLVFSAVQIYGKALSVELSNKTIAAGTQGTLDISIVKSQTKRMKVKPRVLLITNDPKRPKVIISVKVK